MSVHEPTRLSNYSSTTDMTHVHAGPATHFVPSRVDNRTSDHIIYRPINPPPREIIGQPLFARTSNHTAQPPLGYRSTQPVPHHIQDIILTTIQPKPAAMRHLETPHHPPSSTHPTLPISKLASSAIFTNTDNDELRCRLAELIQENMAVKKLNRLLIQKLRALNELSNN